MEKISSIVPRSRRVASTDLASAPAVRPGTPSYGRPIGSSTMGTKDILTTAQRAMAEQQKVAENRKTSALSPDLVEDMTNRFFLQRMTTVEPPALGLQPNLPQVVGPQPQPVTALGEEGSAQDPSAPVTDPNNLDPSQEVREAESSQVLGEVEPNQEGDPGEEVSDLAGEPEVEAEYVPIGSYINVQA